MRGTLFEAKVKPFLKWAGGKKQLLDEIDRRLPQGLKDGSIDTYVEPFVGGGAVFFHIKTNYPSIKKFYLLDINQDLVNCYQAIKNDVESLIEELAEIEKDFLTKERGNRKRKYYEIRDKFNSDRDPAKLICLNRTCFNGLYRVNKKGEFNVPFGDYKNPKICDEENLRAVSDNLQNTKILCVDFEKSQRYADPRSFYYLDPPYRPLNQTSSFTSYSKESFTQQDQVRLAEFCKRISAKGAFFLLSNSDPKNEDPNDTFFEGHYCDFKIERVNAIRAINCKGAGRGEIKELLITNYTFT